MTEPLNLIRLDGHILVERLQRDGRIHAVDSATIRNWRVRGIDLYKADKWCVRLGYHPFEVFGDLFYQQLEGANNG